MLKVLCWAAMSLFAVIAGAGRASASGSDTLEVPFFDDFSYLSDRPDDSLWDNLGASVSTNIPVLPPSLGALVLDALDSDGDFYKSAAYSSQSEGDTIMSKPINLYYPGNKTLYLSFYYEAGGYGDRPEEQDSLCLDFYSPLDSAWTNVWTASQAPQKSFAQTIINISERKYLQKGFRFRFRNYFSLGSSLQPDLVSNCDFWLLDYVKLDKNRNAADTVYSDVSITNYPIFHVGDYQSVPWTHYTEDPDRLANSYTIYYRNNDDKARLLDSVNMVLSHDGKSETFALGTYNMPSYMDFTNNNTDFQYTFSSKSDTIADYDISVRLVSDVTSLDYAGNNNVTINKVFHDYYSYDDGTAEAAYGLHGEGSLGGYAAVRYVTMKPDMLNGVYMYFCPVYDDQQADYFNIKVWNCVDGLPSAEIYSKDAVNVPKDQTGKFVFFPFDESIMVTDTFFVGWEKLSTSIIAIGFDKNTQAPNYKYYNLGSSWKKSSEKGQVMMRPSFGALRTSTDDIQPYDIAANSVKIYPNPASDYLHLEYPEGFCSETFTIYTISGQPVLRTTVSGTSADIDVSQLKPGLYIISSDKHKVRQKVMVIN